MVIAQKTIDDLLNRVFSRILKRGRHINPTRGAALELTSVLLQLTNPRARVSLTETKGRLFSSLGELLWYLAASNDLGFIAYYLSRYAEESDDQRTIYGAYGPRLFNMRGTGTDQIRNVITLLRRNTVSRKAVIQLFDADDLADRHKEIPCTCTLQFMIRENRLEMLTSMRSNDAFLGLPHDIFAFTMLQEIMARTLGVELGTYSHMVGSLHLYDKNHASARAYLGEGVQSSLLEMPAMPTGDPWPSIRKVLELERAVRDRNGSEAEVHDLDPYWADLVRLLEIYGRSKKGEWPKLREAKRGMSTHVYDVYIEELETRAKRKQIRTSARNG